VSRRNATILAGLLLSAAAALGAALHLTSASPFKETVRTWLSNSPAERQAQEILGPFSTIARQVAGAVYGAVLPDARSSLHWPFLLLTVVLAVAIFLVRGGRGAKGMDGKERPCGLVEYLLPRGIYLHPSARVDIGLYLLDRALLPVWSIVLLGLLAPKLEQTTIATLQFCFGASPKLQICTAWKLCYGLVTLLLVDMGFFFYHLIMHKTRIGWAIHKVHHSAEVLTPLTRMREHFLEAPIEAAFTGAGLVLSSGLFAYLFGAPITEITVMNVGIFFFLYALNGNFRHYHVSLRYPRWLEYWLQSPGMHHTHHSYLRQHWDTNLGLVTSVWDRLFGTLYIAEADEATPWGLGPVEQANYRTLSQNLAAPFREFHAMWRGRPALGARDAGQMSK
jgi:sterol desaturase/sphingolipid hydroxylase (fatty acid hydroxylase superfamily)